MELEDRLKNYVKSNDKLATALFSLAVSGTTLLVKAASVSGNGGP